MPSTFPRNCPTCLSQLTFGGAAVVTAGVGAGVAGGADPPAFTAAFTVVPIVSSLLCELHCLGTEPKQFFEKRVSQVASLRIFIRHLVRHTAHVRRRRAAVVQELRQLHHAAAKLRAR